MTPDLSGPVADGDAALARLQSAVEQLTDADLARAHFGGGWSVGQVISHINLCTILWLGDLQRLAADPDLDFFFREEIGHDAVGYFAPTVEIASRKIASTRGALAAYAGASAGVADRIVEIPDLGKMTVAEWTPIIVGHVGSHVEQAFEIMRNREFAPAGV